MHNIESYIYEYFNIISLLSLSYTHHIYGFKSVIYDSDHLYVKGFNVHVG